MDEEVLRVVILLAGVLLTVLIVGAVLATKFRGILGS